MQEKMALLLFAFGSLSATVFAKQTVSDLMRSAAILERATSEPQKSCNLEKQCGGCTSDADWKWCVWYPTGEDGKSTAGVCKSLVEHEIIKEQAIGEGVNETFSFSSKSLCDADLAKLKGQAADEGALMAHKVLDTMFKMIKFVLLLIPGSVQLYIGITAGTELVQCIASDKLVDSFLSAEVKAGTEALAVKAEVETAVATEAKAAYGAIKTDVASACNSAGKALDAGRHFFGYKTAADKDHTDGMAAHKAIITSPTMTDEAALDAASKHASKKENACEHTAKKAAIECHKKCIADSMNAASDHNTGGPVAIIMDIVKGAKTTVKEKLGYTCTGNVCTAPTTPKGGKEEKSGKVYEMLRQVELAAQGTADAAVKMKNIMSKAPHCTNAFVYMLLLAVVTFFPEINPLIAAIVGASGAADEVPDLGEVITHLAQILAGSLKSFAQHLFQNDFKAFLLAELEKLKTMAKTMLLGKHCNKAPTCSCMPTLTTIAMTASSTTTHSADFERQVEEDDM